MKRDLPENGPHDLPPGYSRLIQAVPEEVYAAFSNPDALAHWLVPDGMRAKMHWFDFREGGGYSMSLYYGEPRLGKTAAGEDRYTAQFMELVRGERIIEKIRFDSSDAAFLGDMILTVTFEATDAATLVTFHFRDVPPGIRPEDHEAGTRQSLQKLAHWVEDR